MLSRLLNDKNGCIFTVVKLCFYYQVFQTNFTNISYLQTSENMGCVTGNSDDPNKRLSSDLTLAPSSIGNQKLNDADLVRKKDEHKDIKKLAKTVEEMNKKLEEQNSQLAKLKKENEIAKKQSKDSIEQKEIKIKMIEGEKNKEIEKLKKELEKQKIKNNQKPGDKLVVGGQLKEKQVKPIGLVSLQSHKSLCDQCFYKLPRHIVINNSSGECYSCKGYGLVLDRFPFGANPSCDKSLCFTKGWEKVKCLKVCTVCSGKGFQEVKMYYARKY